MSAETTNRRTALVPDSSNLDALRAAAVNCRICPWAADATQTVFGEGQRGADYLFVGEQPGDQEDLRGHPFVGPAGQLFDRALEQAGIDRNQAYVTNAVKHFKWTPRGKRRIHQKPAAGDIKACRPWLRAEIASVGPSHLICLGTTAIHAVFGKALSLGPLRGQWHETELCARTLVTTHPSAVLRAPDEQARELAFAALVQDLRMLTYET